MNYRKFYKEYYGIEFSKDYEIHHIDFNRKNNDIKNLLLLPKKIHQEYHRILLKNNFSKNDNYLSVNITEFNQTQRECFREIREYNKIFEEVMEWVEYKEYLEGKLPNINNIELEV